MMANTPHDNESQVMLLIGNHRDRVGGTGEIMRRYKRD